MLVLREKKNSLKYKSVHKERISRTFNSHINYTNMNTLLKALFLIINFILPTFFEFFFKLFIVYFGGHFDFRAYFLSQVYLSFWCV